MPAQVFAKSEQAVSSTLYGITVHSSTIPAIPFSLLIFAAILPIIPVP